MADEKPALLDDGDADIETARVERATVTAKQEADNYAAAIDGYRPPDEHATQPDQVDPVPQAEPRTAAKPTTAGEGE